MADVLLDTDVLSLFLRRDEAVVRRADEVFIRQGALGISVITVFEVLRGLNKAGLAERAEQFEEFVSSANVYDLDEEAARLAGEIAADLDRAGQTLPAPDVLIAAIARRNELTLVSRNRAHFERIPDLRLETWE